MDKDKATFILTTDEGEDITCEVLFTFESDETGENYIVYTDNTLDETKNIKVYASTFDPNKEDSPLIPIKTEKEWDVIENIMNSLQEKAQDTSDK